MNELAVRNISFSYDGEMVLENFTCDFTAPGCYALMGPSGGGKTTLLHILAGLLKPRHGKVLGFDRVKVSIMFQEDRLLEQLTGLENVALVSDEAAAEKWLRALGLGDKLNEKPRELSGGQRRRVVLARCLAFGGDILLLDEPFTGLDEQSRANACGLIKQNFPHVIISTHDRDEAALLDGRIINL